MLIKCFAIYRGLSRHNEMESYRKYNSRHHDSRHHKHHKHRHRHHHYRHDDGEHDSHRTHQRHHSHRSSDDEYEYNRVQSSKIEKPPSPTHHQSLNIRRPVTPPPPLPPHPTQSSVALVEKPKERNWKLIADPVLTKTSTKIYRYDGVVPNDSSYPEVIVQDPRTFKSKNKTITLPIELEVPKFKVCILNNFYANLNKHVIL